ncbi:sugar transferase [uncultured Desulfuromonas sp.]|uniref:sugar transferase n=1 Tax=uncultured Desulfuromonas sp. TaxID=181013 RepID=UPI00263090B7|nr:sugar transferase [uncultured Desulfuromonas sp.]
MRRPRQKPEPREGVLQKQPGKRTLDLLVTSAALSLLLPVIVVVAFLVRVRLGSPFLFRQVRPGLYEKPFKLLKFRTMSNARDEDGRLLPDGQRLTAFGRFLRRSSLDELPGLFNVLRGDMSLVGPRPLLTKYLPYYSGREKSRHTVRPGFTGWAQIHGRNFLPWDERLALDVWYVENWSLRLDLYILVMTFWKVLRSEGVAPDTDEVEPDLDHEREGRGECRDAFIP